LAMATNNNSSRAIWHMGTTGKPQCAVRGGARAGVGVGVPARRAIFRISDSSLHMRLYIYRRICKLESMYMAVDI
jgi:hypothetical protein